MSYQQAIGYLYGLQQHGMKFGLDNIRTLMSIFGNPHHAFRSVHVAGTNGKGSTSAMIESILRTSGVRTGLFTSPHLLSFTERIRINGEETGEDEVIALAEEVKTAAGKIEDFSPTFFEVVTAMAFLHFRNKGVEWAVVETGLGGRLDATNVIVPEVSVITRIGLDHCDFLGRTLCEVAKEKAGIIKEGIPVVSADHEAEAIKVVSAKSAEKHSALYTFGKEFTAGLVAESFGGITLNYSGDRDYRDLCVALPGSYQMVNASLALKTVEVISSKFPGLRFDIVKGLTCVRWPGRLELVRDDPPVLIDGAHNPQASLALSDHLKKIVLARYRRIILVIGAMGDKDIEGILGPLLPLAAEILFAAPAYGRAASPDRLAAAAAKMGYPSIVAQSVAEAIVKAEELRQPGDLVLITGSFYTIGEAKEFLGSKGVLTRLRE
ncbi:MAG: bifunctional folylpolyglutamate synthase/dihydrofolate synthase [Nitrospiraceae bacterium]|nr:bifunctional folylpolyglutamate synthase/dihydrofolate synthase [Nitrospiraceae bacterium]